jgi:AcrR family transcriptional regulator
MKSDGTRKYEMKKRAAALDETRRKITEATVELHRTVGPSATTITDVAERAGVRRATVYNHFPDEVSLLASCSAHWRALHPPPDVKGWVAVDDDAERLRIALRQLYSWYRETEPMTANVLRDAETMPALGNIIANGLGRYLSEVRKILAGKPKARGRRRDRVEAAAAVAADFHTWRSLAALGDGEAAEVAAGFIESARAD